MKHCAKALITPVVLSFAILTPSESSGACPSGDMVARNLDAVFNLGSYENAGGFAFPRTSNVQGDLSGALFGMAQEAFDKTVTGTDGMGRATETTVHTEARELTPLTGTVTIDGTPFDAVIEGSDCRAHWITITTETLEEAVLVQTVLQERVTFHMLVRTLCDGAANCLTGFGTVVFESIEVRDGVGTLVSSDSAETLNAELIGANDNALINGAFVLKLEN